MDELSCQKVIGKACFKAFPAFARRAIAYRLLHLLIPPDIAKILPKTLKDPLIAPGVKIPLDAKFPPGTCIVPGCSFPAGWDPDQDPPECAKSMPLPTAAMLASGANPPTYLTPGPSGPLPVQPPPPPPAEPVEVTLYTEMARRIGDTKTTWALVWASESGNLCSSIFSSGSTVASVWHNGGNAIVRGFFEFDLSSEIPAGATITNVVFQITTSVAPSSKVCIIEGTQADVPTVGDLRSFVLGLFAEHTCTHGANQIEFNSTGIAYMQSKITGSAKICLREFDHDHENAENAAGDQYVCTVYGPGNATPANRPQLIITYTE